MSDPHGDEVAAIRLLTNRLATYLDGSPIDRLQALLFLSELAARTGDAGLARSSLDGALSTDPVSAQRALFAGEFDHAMRVVDEIES
jgi:hypothetical protein